MLGLLGVGVAVIAGVGLRIAAVTGTAEWPLARFTETGQASGSTHPIVDYHLLCALVLIVLAAVYAGNTWGLVRSWANLAQERR